MRVRALLSAGLIMLLLPAAAYANYPHVVQPGETLTSVAATDGLSVEAIAAANGISPQAELVAGRVLWIPPRTLTTAGAGAAATGTTGAVSTATDDAATTSTHTQIDPDNDGDNDADNASDSTTSLVSTSSTTRQAATSSSDASQTQTATQQTVTSGVGAEGVPVPTAERVSASEIASIASANGVPAAFAEAIAWQESGWNNDEVSGAGAVGVMQIVPATWTWIDRYLTPSNPLGTASAAENVRAGVLLLRQLLQLTGGNERLAAAGYFQGLKSVQARGMYASTRQYVNDVMALTGRL